MGSLLGGLLGGILCASFAVLISLPVSTLIFFNKIDFVGEIGLFYLFGIITGFLVNKERTEKEKSKQAEHLALLGKAAAAIAHELKTPIVVIGGFANVLQKNFSPKDPSWKKLDIILKETKWMGDMVHGILDFSKPLQIKLKTIEIEPLLKEVINLISVGSKADIQLNFLTRIPQVKVDPDRFKQVLINLINNAVQAAPDKPVKINVFFQKNWVVIEIIDQGPGIPEEYKEKIFEPFFSTKARGTGLGLAIVKKIINAHHGKISFKSKPAEGTTFIVSIPASPLTFAK
ncbi:MAG: HAMP domain-containing histidine kinase [Candidatus Desulfofervidaceae bacterium]|nr:HAMP domain-containing histidine kinase [Candidatus Desulfofervidaceae bacterium]